jgi:hypothetical protein
MSENAADLTAPIEAQPESAASAPVEPVAPAEPVESTPEPDPAPATGTDVDVDQLKADIARWQAMSRKNEARAKENADKAKRLDEIEEANKTELQKISDRAARAETALAEAKMLALRAEKSASTGVPMALIPAGPEEAMEEAIAAFQGALTTALKSRPGPAAAPAQVVTTGAESTKVKQLTRADLSSMSSQQVLEAQRNGQLDELMGKSS